MSAAALAIALPTPVAGAGQSAVPMSAESASERLARVSRPAPLRARREGALVREAQRGSEEALEELFRRHWRRAHRAAYLVVGDAAAAEDIAQESFLAAIRALDRFDRRRPFGPWLHRITVNRSIDFARARSLRGETAMPAAGDLGPPTRGTASEPVEPDSGPLSESVLEALAALAPEQRAVVVLRHLLGYTPSEIGEILGLPRGTVNSRMRRALDRLRPAIERER